MENLINLNLMIQTIFRLGQNENFGSFDFYALIENNLELVSDLFYLNKEDLNQLLASNCNYVTTACYFDKILDDFVDLANELLEDTDFIVEHVKGGDIDIRTGERSDEVTTPLFELVQKISTLDFSVEDYYKKLNY